MGTRLIVACGCLGLMAGGVLAQPAPAATATATPSAASAPPQRVTVRLDPSVSPSGVPEAKVQRIVVEDDRVRIDELRVRGQTRRIAVQPKVPGAPGYQIGTNTDARDPSMDPRSEGRALWQLLAF